MIGGKTPPATRRTAIRRIVGLLIVLVALSVLGYKLGWFDLGRVTAVVERLRRRENAATTGAIFFVVYAVATAIGFPALPLTVAGGAIFGHLLGATLSWAGAVTGSILGYFLAGGVGREAARRWITRSSIGESLTESTSFFTLLRIRLLPFVPLSIVNFAAGLARMHIGAFVAATAIGIIPATAVFAYFADSLVQGLAGARTDAYRNIAIASGVLILLSLMPILIRRWDRG